MRGNLEKREGPAPFRSAVLAFLLIGGLLLLMLFCGWLYAGTSGAVITTILAAIILMLVRKVSPQFFLLLSGARSIHPEDMPALFGIIASLCRRAGIGQVPSLYFLPSGVPTAFATGVGDQSVIVVSSGLLRLLMTRELTGVLAHEITHIAKHDVELMQLARIVGQMTRVIAQVAIIIAIATWLLDIFGPGEGVDGLSLGVLVAAPIAANLILGALSRMREYQADLEAVALTDDAAGLARGQGGAHPVVAEGAKLCIAHFARSHQKFSMHASGDIASDRDVVRLVGQNEPGRRIAVHQFGDNRWIGGVSTNNAMLTEAKYMAETRDRDSVGLGRKRC